MFETKSPLKNIHKDVRGAVTQVFVYLLVIIIVCVGVVLPIVNNLVATSGLTGVALLVVSLFGTIIALYLLIAVADVF